MWGRWGYWSSFGGFYPPWYFFPKNARFPPFKIFNSIAAKKNLLKKLDRMYFMNYVWNTLQINQEYSYSELNSAIHPTCRLQSTIYNLHICFNSLNLNNSNLGPNPLLKNVNCINLLKWSSSHPPQTWNIFKIMVYPLFISTYLTNYLPLIQVHCP